MPLDERIQRLTDTIIEEVRAPIEEALRRLVSDVMLAASEDREQAVHSALSAAAAGHETSVAALRERAEHDRSDAAAARDQLAGLREQMEAEREAALAHLRENLERDREAALAGLRENLERDREAAIAGLRAELEGAREAALAALRLELERERVEAVARRQDELQREHEAALAGAEDARRDAEARAAALEQALEQARQQADHARQDAEQRQLAADQARQDAEQRQLAAEQDLQAAHAADRQHELACSDRILAAVRRLDEARSLSEVLRVLADQAEAEIGRAALLLVTGSRLRAWEWRNLPAADLAALDVPVDPDSVFGAAIASGLPASTSEVPIGAAGDRLAALLAAPPGRAGLAVPISVGGRVVAILYADEGGDRTPIVPSNWPELAEILARHAGRCLELLTISHASVLAGRVVEERAAAGREPAAASPLADERLEEESARRYARLLISEIKLYHEAAVEQGRAARDLLARLGPEIERARRLYEEKIPAAVRRRVDCFDQEVVRTLAGGDADVLGRT